MTQYSVSGGRLLADGGPVPFRPSPNVAGSVKPRFLVIHFTGGGEAGAIERLTSLEDPRVSAHFVVGEKGTITQLVPLDRVAWHAGPSQWRGCTAMNSNSIGIEIANYGDAVDGGPGRYTAFGHPIPDDRVMVARHKNGGPVTAWHTYTPAQVEAVTAIAKAMHEVFGFEDIVGHDDIAPSRKTDPGPAWNMAALKAAVFGGAAVPVSPPAAPIPGGARRVETAADVQAALNTLGYGPLEVDGDIGPASKAAVGRFQRVAGLVDDGDPGPKTKAALAAALAERGK